MGRSKGQAHNFTRHKKKQCWHDHWLCTQDMLGFPCCSAPARYTNHASDSRFSLYILLLHEWQTAIFNVRGVYRIHVIWCSHCPKHCRRGFFLVLLRPLNFHRHRSGWLPPNLSGPCFLKTVPHFRRAAFRCTTLALTQTDIRHRHCGGMSKITTPLSCKLLPP